MFEGKMSERGFGYSDSMKESKWAYKHERSVTQP